LPPLVCGDLGSQDPERIVISVNSASLRCSPLPYYSSASAAD